MVFHCQPVGVRGVANIAVVLSDFMEVLVISQAAGVAVCFATFFTGKRPPSTFSWIKLLGPGSSSGGVGLLEPLMAVFHAHWLTL